MARPKLLEDATKLNVTLEKRQKRKLNALAKDKPASMSQVMGELIDAAPRPSRESERLAEIDVP